MKARNEQICNEISAGQQVVLLAQPCHLTSPGVPGGDCHLVIKKFQIRVASSGKALFKNVETIDF